MRVKQPDYMKTSDMGTGSQICDNGPEIYIGSLIEPPPLREGPLDCREGCDSSLRIVLKYTAAARKLLSYAAKFVPSADGSRGASRIGLQRKPSEQGT